MKSIKLFRIETGIKLPPPARSQGNGKPSPIVATMQALDKGQSFLIKDPIVAVGAAKIMRDFVRRERKHARSRQFVSRKAGAGVRIWRVK